MSLEAKLAALTIDDAPSVVETVKAEGPEKSGLAGNYETLVARCASKDEKEAIAALKTLKALAEGAPSAQVFTKECLAGCKFISSDSASRVISTLLDALWVALTMVFGHRSDRHRWWWRPS